jgi:hypothetical protein
MFEDTQSLQSAKPTIIVTSVSAMFLNLQSTYDKLLTRRKIPENVRVLGISTEHFPAIIDLHQSLFNKIDRPEVLRRLSGNSDIVNYCKETSTLLLLKNKVIGVTIVLSKRSAALAYVYAVIIDPGYRRTWATVYLKYHSLACFLSSGIEEIAFQAFAGNLDTINYAQKVGAKIVADNYKWSE